MFQSPNKAKRVLAYVLAALIVFPNAAFAQAASKPAESATAAQKVQLLFVQNSAGVVVDSAKGTLRLENVSPSTLFFTDRPVRMAGHYHTRDEFLKLWNEGPDSFAKNPPNATLSILEPGQPDLQDVVVNIRNPRMEGHDLVYDFKLIEGTPPKAGKAAVLFIDVLGFWRRNIRRVAIVGTAATVATVATVGAAEASAAQASAAQANAAAAQANANAAAARAAAAPPQSAATKKLEQLKSLLNEGLISQAQYQKASQQVLNEVVN